MRYIYLAIVVLLGAISCSSPTKEYDVVIIGGTTSGTAAGIRSARLGASTLVVEPSTWLGGMLTSAGVSATDGNYKLRGALWGEFRDSLEAHYGGAEALKTGWVSHVLFEPSVGNRIFQNIAKGEESLDVWFQSNATAFEQLPDDSWVVRINRDGESVEVKCRVLIDATELGDVAKSVGVEYEVGMDSREKSGESIAPIKGNDIVQDLTYAVILKDYHRDVTIARPEGYDSLLFAACCINELATAPKEAHRLWSKEMLITYGKLPNDKYMINWPIEGNDYYVNMVEMSAEERAAAEQEAKNHTLSFLYFLQTQLGFNTLSIADDEFPTADGMPLTPYHRESRRIEGVVRFTLNHITDPFTTAEPLYRTAIGVGDYPVDQHHTRYSGWSELPDLYFYPIPSYGVPAGVMIPAEKRSMLVAEKSISVTNIVNGSSRLQPVVLQIGEAAGALAALAIERGCDVREVSVRDLQSEILAGGGYLLPYLDLPQGDPHFAAMQRIGVTGIIKGHGANVGWENQTWFEAAKSINCGELIQGLSELYTPTYEGEPANNVTAQSLAEIIASIMGQSASQVEESINAEWSSLKLENYDNTRALSRIECAVIINSLLNPFETIEVDLEGNFIK